MILTPDGDVYVEDASDQGREIEGVRWNENRAFPSGIRRERAYACRRELGDVQLYRAEERPQRLRHGLASIGATHVSLIPRMESGGRSTQASGTSA